MKKRNEPLVSIILPCFNSSLLINNCLASLFNQTYPNFEILLVDDHSTDGTITSVKSSFKEDKRLLIFSNRGNCGPSKRRNDGIRKARGKYVAFFETDMEADKNWLATLVAEFEKDQKMGAAHSRVMDLKRKKCIQADGMRIIPYTGWVVMRNYGLTPNQADSSLAYVVIGSVGTMARRKVLLKIGGFDEKLGHKVDDIDMGWRIWLAGYKTVCLPDAVAYHWGGKPQSARPISTLAAEKYFNRMPRVFVKNYELKNLLHYLPWLVGLHFIRGIRHLFYGNWRPLIGFLDAMLWTMRYLPDTLLARQQVQSTRRISDAQLMKSVMIEGNFFSLWRNYVIPLHQTAHNVFGRL